MESESESSETDLWFSTYLGTPCSLVRFSQAPCHRRDGVCFANEGQILLISRSSVDLMTRLAKQAAVDAGEGEGEAAAVTALHFRPNLAVDSGVAHEEESWATVRVSEGAAPRVTALSVSGHCERCALVDLNPKTGVVDGRTLRTLAAYRRRHGGRRGKIVFGVFLAGGGSGGVAAGDAVVAA